MYIKQEVDFEFLQKNCWSGAIETLKKIEENNKEDEFIELLEELFYEDIPELIKLNDFLWFDNDYIYESLNIELEE